MFELGNEQYNSNFTEQVAAMEARASQVGMEHTLNYIFPQNGGPNSLDSLKLRALGIEKRVIVDIHSGATGGVASAEKLFLQNATKTFGAINMETNTADH